MNEKQFSFNNRNAKIIETDCNRLFGIPFFFYQREKNCKDRHTQLLKVKGQVSHEIQARTENLMLALETYIFAEISQSLTR